MKTSNWDAIVTSAPLNTDAAIARDGRGISFDLPKKATLNAQDVPFPTKPYPGAQDAIHNLTGQRFQKLVVVGLLDREGSNGGASWACRCDCGRYSRFKAATLRSLRQRGRAMCSECDYIEEVKAQTHGIVSQEEKDAQARKRAARIAADEMLHPRLEALRADAAAQGIDEIAFTSSIGEFIRRIRQGDQTMEAAP